MSIERKKVMKKQSRSNEKTFCRWAEHSGVAKMRGVKKGETVCVATISFLSSFVFFLNPSKCPHTVSGVSWN
jgi:hypothetical protein